MLFFELLKAIFLGVVEGITEWLPVSSTGHLILVQEFIKLNQDKAFLDMFNIVIQFGPILAVIVIYFKRFNPFQPAKTAPDRRQSLRTGGTAWHHGAGHPWLHLR